MRSLDRRPFSESLFSARSSRKVPLIAEIKCRSPKEGDLIGSRDPVALAQAMERAGAACISVVTEPEHYGGSLDLLNKVAAVVNIPVLRKDFIRSEQDIHLTKEAGASCVLLIASFLDLNHLARLSAYARNEGLETLVEVGCEAELKTVLSLELDLLGINNRDIKQLETDDGTIAKALELIKLVPPNTPVISESAVSSPEDVEALIKAGVVGVLVGTAVLKSEDVESAVRSLVWAAPN
ncbi:MAG: indole-3-glycerol-phosphate synthase [Armatimonadota bacterium]|nr:indole-3-glycerol-phosphate synthase [Armatimonadota bacterium]